MHLEKLLKPSLPNKNNITLTNLQISSKTSLKMHIPFKSNHSITVKWRAESLRFIAFKFNRKKHNREESEELKPNLILKLQNQLRMIKKILKEDQHKSHNIALKKVALSRKVLELKSKILHMKRLKIIQMFNKRLQKQSNHHRRKKQEKKY